MDTEYPVDLRAVFEAIDYAEVIVFRFVTIPQRLLFDSRHNEMEGPLLKLVAGAGSPQERLKTIKQMRPRFRLPQEVNGFWWPRYVHSLEESGARNRILHRIDECGFPGIADEARGVFREAERRERAELFNAIIGAGYHGLWERTR